MRSMKRFHLALVLFFTLALIAPQAICASSYVLSVVTDRPEALYQVGESVTFEITLKAGGKAVEKGEVAFVITNDGESLIEEGAISLSQGAAERTSKLEAPGFLRCAVTATVDGATVGSATAAAGFDPLKIKASLPAPDDFDAFWEAQREALNKVPMNPVLTPIDSPQEGLACFDVQLNCLGEMPVSGYYARPTEAAAKSLPAVLWTHGAGVDSSVIRRDVAAKGMLVLDINAHGIPNGKPRSYYQDLREGALKDYRYRGRESRETYYFLGMYLRIMRALDFLTSQPEWDGKVLFARGSSQGGGQALVTAGLDKRVTALIANVPAMCDHSGRINGWPRLVPRNEAGAPDPGILEAARYFDAMNFAARSKAQALVSVGFIDETCRPTTVYAAYNNLQGKKRMLNKPLMKHAFPPEWNAQALAMMLAHIKAMKGDA